MPLLDLNPVGKMKVRIGSQAEKIIGRRVDEVGFPAEAGEVGRKDRNRTSGSDGEGAHRG